jgi:hypothetical protein
MDASVFDVLCVNVWEDLLLVPAAALANHLTQRLQQH